MSKIILILGGARSGKSTFAEEAAKKLGEDNVTYLATAQALDAEMEERILHHKDRRSSKWQTIEEPLYLNKAFENIDEGKTVLLDCLTLYISNRILQAQEEKQKENLEKDIINDIKNIIMAAYKKDLNLIIVSNEVGQGVVPPHKLGRLFRDIAGRANQFTAQKADHVFYTIAGFPVDIKEISLNKKEDYLNNLGE